MPNPKKDRRYYMEIRMWPMFPNFRILIPRRLGVYLARKERHKGDRDI